MDPQDLFNFVQHDVFGHISHVDHPRFFAFIPSPSNYIGVLADALASGYNVFAGTWVESSGPAVVELTTIDWLRQLCGFPETGGGLFVEGGSVANLTALAAARHTKLGTDFRNGIIYYSDQTHSSLERGLRILGFTRDNIRKLPSNAGFCLDVASLQAAIAEDRAAGRQPFCVVANAGATNTGTVDPLSAIADVCNTEDLWLHATGRSTWTTTWKAIISRSSIPNSATCSTTAPTLQKHIGTTRFNTAPSKARITYIKQAMAKPFTTLSSPTSCLMFCQDACK